jgi:nucleoside-diphosphate-sugar epimerase
MHLPRDRSRKSEEPEVARAVVTGAAGFIGRALCGGLFERGHRVVGLTRSSAEPIPGVEMRPIGEITARTHWPEHLGGADIVIHLANRAHRPARPGAAQHEAEAAAALARAAAIAGVPRLVHMSSVRAMGEATRPGAPFRPSDPALPSQAYGRAKLATERALVAAARETGLELVMLRPPLVYGPAVTANFRALIDLVASGLPLPFAGIDNRRSLIFLGNLVDVAARAAFHPAAAGRVLLVRDPADLSTEELVRRLASELGRPARLFRVPQAALGGLHRLPMLGPIVARLTLSLQVDDGATLAALDWTPPVAPEQGLAATVRALRDR